MTPARRRWAAVVCVAVASAVLGCSADTGPTPGAMSDASPTPTSATPTPEPTRTETTKPRRKRTRDTLAPATPGVAYYAGRRAGTGELLLFAEQIPDTGTGNAALLEAFRTATTRTPLDPDYASLWRDLPAFAVKSFTAKLFWDGDEGFYSVRLAAGTPTHRPRGMSMREAHLAIQQVVWTLHSMGGVQAPVRFSVRGGAETVTDLLGVPATGPYDAYLAADYAGVLNAVNILTVENTASTDGTIAVSGLAESFEGTVGVQVLGPTGEVVVNDSAQTRGCCDRLFPWSYTLDASDWPAGAYTLMAFTDDPVGIAQGSDGPEIDTKTITVP